MILLNIASIILTPKKHPIKCGMININGNRNMDNGHAYEDDSFEYRITH